MIMAPEKSIEVAEINAYPNEASNDKKQATEMLGISLSSLYISECRRNRGNNRDIKRSVCEKLLIALHRL